MSVCRMWSAMELACHNNVAVASDFEAQKIPRSSSMDFDIPGAERLSLLSKGVGAEIWAVNETICWSHHRPESIGLPEGSTLTCCKHSYLYGMARRASNPKNNKVNPSKCRGWVQGQLKPDSASSCHSCLTGRFRLQHPAIQSLLSNWSASQIMFVAADGSNIWKC